MRLKSIKVALVGAAGLLLLIVAAVGFSQGPAGGPRGPRPGPRDGLGPFARDLNLSDDQKAQIKKIRDSFQESTKTLHDQLRTLHESEPDPLGGTFDEAAVRAAAEARAKVEIELAVAHAKMMSQIAAVLTSDQKAQLAAKRQQSGSKPPPPPEPE
jgi:protein CpxP